MRSVLLKLGISIVSVCATLLLLEAGIRIVRPQDGSFWDSRSFRRIQAASPHFVENIPNTHANFIGVPVAINSYGLRGDEISTPKPAHTVRVLAVGDSITFGYGIPVEDTYVRVLERRLNGSSPDSKTRYEVLNGGTLGGSLSDYYHLLTQKAEALQPDVILIGLDLNDILVYSDSGSILEDGAEWHGQRMPVARRLSHLLMRHSQLYLFCYARLKAFLYGSRFLDINKVRGLDFVTLTPPTDYQKRAWESSLAMLTRIDAFCRRHGYRIVVVVFPMQMQLSPSELLFYRDRYHLSLGDEVLSGEPQRRLREFATTEGLPVVDLLPVYRAHDSEQLYLRNKLIPADPTHPSIKGNQLAADEIFHFLKQSLGNSIPAGT